MSLGAGEGSSLAGKAAEGREQVWDCLLTWIPPQMTWVALCCAETGIKPGSGESQAAACDGWQSPGRGMNICTSPGKLSPEIASVMTTLRYWMQTGLFSAFDGD